MYVPRAASERALDNLERRLLEAKGPVVLLGPPGTGKSLLLRLVVGRLEPKCTCLAVRDACGSMYELCSWLLRGLEVREYRAREEGEGSSGLGRLRDWVRTELRSSDVSDPVKGLVDHAKKMKKRGNPLVVLIDDGDGMEEETANELAEMVSRSVGALAVGLALSEIDGTRRVREALGESVAVIPYNQPLSLDETAAYV